MEQMAEITDVYKAIDEYTNSRIKEIGIEKCHYSEKWEYLLLEDFSKLSPVNAVIFALMIGFANGVEWERQNTTN